MDGAKLRGCPVALLGVWKEENLRVFNFPDGDLGGVKPDARLEVVLEGEKDARQLDFCIEYERGAQVARNAQRLPNYEALMAAWHRLVPRYQMLGRARRFVYVAPSRKVALELARLADRTLEVAVGGYEGPHTWQFPARLLSYFAVESDIHRRSARAYVVHPQPAEHRAKLGPRGESARARPSRMGDRGPRVHRRSAPAYLRATIPPAGNAAKSCSRSRRSGPGRRSRTSGSAR